MDRARSCSGFRRLIKSLHKAGVTLTGLPCANIQLNDVAMQFKDIIQFWFHELTAKDHFSKNDRLDASIRDRFGSTLLAAVHGELYTWRVAPLGRLAEIIVLDQFSRNIFRDQPQAFAQDPQALTLAQELVASGQDRALNPAQRGFAYMPYMHSESLMIHEQALSHFSQPGLEGSLAFELKHKEIIHRFGRFPHRNAILGRESTPDEQVFLSQPGSSF